MSLTIGSPSRSLPASTFTGSYPLSVSPAGLAAVAAHAGLFTETETLRYLETVASLAAIAAIGETVERAERFARLNGLVASGELEIGRATPESL